MNDPLTVFVVLVMAWAGVLAALCLVLLFGKDPK